MTINETLEVTVDLSLQHAVYIYPNVWYYPEEDGFPFMSWFLRCFSICLDH